MALDVNATKLASLIDPEVIAPMIEKKMVDAMKFAPLAKIDYTLQGRPGSTVTLPSYAYIGDAADVAEGADIPIAELTESSVTATIKKAGKGVQITDEAILSGYGDPVGEAISQLGTSVASKTDNDVVAILNAIKAPMIYAATGKLTSDVIANSLVKFGEDLDGDKVLLIAPEQLAQLRTSEDWISATDMGVQALMSGVVGMIWGCQVVISNKIVKTGVAPNTTYSNFVVKPGALAIYMKRDTLLETDRDIINKSTVMTVDKHYVAYLYDASKAIKITTVEGQ
jgi:N4-gp56 family major capsid protein